MTNREAHPDYASYPVGMTVTRRCWDEKTTVTKRGDDDWVSSKGFPMGDKFIFDDEPVEGRLGVIIVHDPRTAGQPFAFAPVGDGTTKDTVYVFECACCGTDSRCPMHGAPRVRPAKESDMPIAKPSALLVALREAEAAIQRAIELETTNRPFAGLNRGE